MKWSLPVAFLVALPTSAGVYAFGDVGHPVAYVFGSLVIAALTSVATGRAHGRRPVVYVAIALLTVLLLPFVAALVTGAAAGLLEAGPEAVPDGVGSGLAGAVILYVPLVGAAALAWGASAGARAASNATRVFVAGPPARR